MKSVIYEKLAQRLQHAGLADDGCAGLADPVDLIDAASTIRALQSRLESLENDAALLDWLGKAPTGVIRMDFNPFAPTYINYSASGGNIRPALTKAMQSANKGE